MLTYLLLAAAGFAGSVMNAVAGGGTFVTLPALIGVGLPSTVANATSTVALCPGGLMSAWTYRRDLQPVGPLSLKALIGLSIAGGLTGALLLLATPTRLFDQVVPWLLLAATVMLLFGQRLRLWLIARRVHIGKGVAYPAQFLIAIYGGYFGGAVGLVMLAVWTLVSDLDIKANAPARLLIFGVMNLMAVAVFALAGAVAWPQCLAMLGGALAGGYLGARLGQRLPATAVRAIVVVVTVTTTAVFFWRAYG